MPAYRFNWSIIINRWDQFALAALVDLWIALLSFALALVLGLFIAVLRVSGIGVLSRPAVVWVQVMRGVPEYVFVYWVYFGLAAVVVPLTAIEAALVALTLTASGYTSEVFRAGIQAVNPDHIDAARALGLSSGRVFTDVVLPQVFRSVVPPLASVFTNLVKAATVVSVIGVRDMVFLARDIVLRDYTPFEPYTTVGVILFVLVGTFSLLVVRLERVLKVPS